jgi:hypothetical protein
LAVAAIAGALLSGGVACSSDPGDGAADATEDVESLLVSVADDVAESSPLTAEQVEITGSGQPEVTLVRAHGGELTMEPGEDGTPSLRFPVHEDSEDAPVAIVSVTSRDPNWLQPRGRGLVFGADVSLDAVTDGTDQDNGDNVIQRGLFGAAAQLKLQVDHRRPSCLVRGDAGTVLAKSSVTLEAGTWYRVTCRRTADEVAVTVSRLVDGKGVDTSVDRVEGAIGDVRFSSETAVSIGGKLGPNGGPVKDATDQYDGLLSRVHLSIEAGR